MLAAAEGRSLLGLVFAGNLASICEMASLSAAHKGCKRMLIWAATAVSCSSACSLAAACGSWPFCLALMRDTAAFRTLRTKTLTPLAWAEMSTVLLKSLPWRALSSCPAKSASLHSTWAQVIHRPAKLLGFMLQPQSVPSSQHQVLPS